MKFRRKWTQFDPTAAAIECMNLPGVYVIFRAGKPWYVGQSESIRRRLVNYRFENFPGRIDHFHGFTRTPWGDWPWSEAAVTAKAKYTARFGEQLMLEARLIRRLRPPMNKRGA